MVFPNPDKMVQVRPAGKAKHKAKSSKNTIFTTSFICKIQLDARRPDW